MRDPARQWLLAFDVAAHLRGPIGNEVADQSTWWIQIGHSGIDKTHSDPAVGLTASEWQTKARLTPSLVTAGARQWAQQRAVAPHPWSEFVNAGLTIIVGPPAWRFHGLVARPASRPKSSLGTKGALLLKANPGLDQGSTDRRFVRRAHLVGA